jgi:epoxyqueuosine reductase
MNGDPPGGPQTADAELGAPASLPAPLPYANTRALKVRAAELGFDACGIASASTEADDGFDAWLAAGFHADMDWMARTRDLRQQIGLKLPGTQSVVVVARNYYAPRPEAPPGTGRVSRYAWGRDYHRALIKPLRQLAAFLDGVEPGAQSYASIDSGPVRERAWAARAGLGWIGKHSLVIRPELGTWFFLGAVLTTVTLTSDTPMEDGCGNCRACMDACPTGAIVSPRTVDSRKCIAYHSIENKGVIPDAVADKMGGQVFGCDICQQACPWNRAPHATNCADFLPRPNAANPPLERLIAGDAAWFDTTFNGTPVRRAGLEGMRRNAALASKRRTGEEP